MWGLVSSIPAYWIYVAHARPSHQRHTCTRWCQPAMAQFSTVGKLRSNYAHARLDGSECFPISMTTFKSSTDKCFLRDRDRVTSESSYKIDWEVSHPDIGQILLLCPKKVNSLAKWKRKKFVRERTQWRQSAYPPVIFVYRLSWEEINFVVKLLDKKCNEHFFGNLA